ncbi:acetate and sugar kinases/Hsc70/actin family protein [Neobacillus dielmonensis]|uniref:hypothetical protein n=1 Tax=Neobacillus dielmonensis TaxID=1347369 RepID=UPI000693AF09|nr:hypothetical protein [Neobacillus dielmonensis]
MEANTKVQNYLYVHTNEVDAIIDTYLENLMLQTVDHLNDKAVKLYEYFTKKISENWVKMANGVYYNNKLGALFPDLTYYKCIRTSNTLIANIDENKFQFSGYNGRLMNLDELRTSYNSSENFPFKSGNNLIYNGSDKSLRMAYKKSSISLGGYDIDDGSLRDEPGIVMPIYRLGNRKNLGFQDAIKLWMKHRLVPANLNEQFSQIFTILIELHELNYLDENLQIQSSKLWKDVLNQKFTGSIGNIHFDKAQLKNQMLEAKSNVILDSQVFYDQLLYCESERADIEVYDSKILTDPNRGHWDLWEAADRQDLVKVTLNESLIARNPVADIKRSGVVGIDFGTKSTVVVYQENNDYTLPMRVGVGHFNQKVEPKHFENPTVMEFIDLDSFLTQYHLKIGRPNTSWEDMTVSHTAYNKLMNSPSEHYYSFLTDIKQWAGDKQRQIRLKDKMGKDVVLPSFLDVGEDDLNPIELYAYYLGLYINNQHHGIYLDYMLSFPVTYEKEAREKILDSFEKGIKKSLPPSLLRNEQEMAQFRIVSGASEPAAYAICALQEYGFEPMDGEKFFYGVFDFGGGTTDFDFGIWREAGRKERRYDFVIEHFAAGGDKFLGGENLLELLAFEVFKANQDKLREAEISFVLPPECQRFAGSETLLSDSQEAKLNMKQLMEVLRPLWENHQNAEIDYDMGLIRVTLFDKYGNSKTNVELYINREGLEKLIESRIEKGIRNFFDSLRRSFEQAEISSVQNVHIFLAGNSSRSPIVQNLFERYIEEETQSINRLNETNQRYFEIFPPLGTDEAYEKMEQWGITFDRNAIERPTGKTGVAFGLVQSRKGGRIKVIDHNVVGDEVKFKYFIGMNRRGKFRVVLDREEAYNEWHEFIDASEEDFELYYTSLPEASRNQMDIHHASRKKCKIDRVDDSAFVYVRTVSPTVIEYVTATEDGITTGNFLGDIMKLELS